MPEREPIHPEIAAALRAYEIEIRDGTERSQQKAFERLRQLQQNLGGAAILKTNLGEQSSSLPPADTDQLASS